MTKKEKWELGENTALFLLSTVSFCFIAAAIDTDGANMKTYVQSWYWAYFASFLLAGYLIAESCTGTKIHEIWIFASLGWAVVAVIGLVLHWLHILSAPYHALSGVSAAVTIAIVAIFFVWHIELILKDISEINEEMEAIND